MQLSEFHVSFGSVSQTSQSLLKDNPHRRWTFLINGGGGGGCACIPLFAESFLWRTLETGRESTVKQTDGSLYQSKQIQPWRLCIGCFSILELLKHVHLLMARLGKLIASGLEFRVQGLHLEFLKRTTIKFVARAVTNLLQPLQYPGLQA